MLREPLDFPLARRVRRPISRAALVAALFLLGGCGATGAWIGGGGGSDTDSRRSDRSPAARDSLDTFADVLDDADAASPAGAEFARSRLVALDFVDAMVRLPELAPERTTLYAGRPSSRFGELLIASLQEAGYDLRLGVGGPGTTLGYRVVADAPRAPGGSSYTFHVRAGAVRLQRRYHVDLAGVRPVTAMRLHGADGAALDTRLPPLAASASAPAPGSVPRARATGARSAASGGTLAGASTETSRMTLVKLPATKPPGPAPTSHASPSPTAGTAAEPRAADGPAGARDAAPARKRNMFGLGRSNYAALLGGYDTLRRDVMVFPNDSLHMGADNKRLARDIVAAFDPGRDLLSVIGCSHGPTALVNGNETLAIGRSYRVKEEFMLAGIDADLVLDEGCWAGVAHERLPARGVVVTHRRRTVGG